VTATPPDERRPAPLRDQPDTPSVPPRQLHPLPRGLVELYGLLAVLVVLVPEWMANGALLGLGGRRHGAELPPSTLAWQRVPELRLASLSVAELRQLAASLGVGGYAGDSRQVLSARLLRRLQRQRRRGKAL
jgi:hypothetical protein